MEYWKARGFNSEEEYRKSVELRILTDKENEATYLMRKAELEMQEAEIKRDRAKKEGWTTIVSAICLATMVIYLIGSTIYNFFK